VRKTKLLTALAGLMAAVIAGLFAAPAANAQALDIDTKRPVPVCRGSGRTA
jgi:hypothetical protein